METKNYQLTMSGVLLASGAGVATVTVRSIASWAIGSSDTIAPTVSGRHSLQYGIDKPMSLGAAEHLWGFGDDIAAVTAEVPAAGDI